MQKRNIKLAVLSLICLLFISTSDVQAQTLKERAEALKEKMGVGGSSGASKGKTQNAIDQLKESRPDLVTEVKSGKVQEKITIRLEDGTVLNGGQTFTPKNFTNGWVDPGQGFSTKFKDSEGQKVTISRSGKPDMYGILEFNNVYEKCSGLPAARSYFIQIPESYFSQAAGGNTTVLYEYYTCQPILESTKEVEKKGKIKTVVVKEKEHRYTTWVLWLSDVKF